MRWDLCRLASNPLIISVLCIILGSFCEATEKGYIDLTY